MGPIAWVGLGVAPRQLGVRSRWSGWALIAGGIVFPVSRIGDIAPLAIVDDLTLLAARAPIVLGPDARTRPDQGTFTVTSQPPMTVSVPPSPSQRSGVPAPPSRRSSSSPPNSRSTPPSPNRRYAPRRRSDPPSLKRAGAVNPNGSSDAQLTSAGTVAAGPRSRPAGARPRAVDQAGAEALRRLRAAGHGEAQALLGRRAAVARGDVAGQEGVAGADRRDRLARLDPDAMQRGSPSSTTRDAAVGQRHDRLPRAERDHLADGDERSSSSLNSWPTSSSASSTFGEMTSGSARTAWRSGSPSVSIRRHDPDLAQLADQPRVDVGVDAARQRAGEDDDLRAAREVEQLVAEQLDLASRRPPGRAR